MGLEEHACIPCQGGTPPLGASKAEELLNELGGTWALNEAGHLWCHYSFKNFKQAMEFANQITDIAEHEGHHPDLFIAWGKCDVEIWTHKIDGLTESDFYLAAKIEQRYEH